MNNVNSIKKIMMNTIYTNTARRVWTMSGVGWGVGAGGADEEESLWYRECWCCFINDNTNANA